jgi:hypothetical protein
MKPCLEKRLAGMDSAGTSSFGRMYTRSRNRRCDRFGKPDTVYCRIGFMGAAGQRVPGRPGKSALAGRRLA